MLPEFEGAPEVCREHASLIVAIRRCYDLKSDVPAFRKLWRDHRGELIEALNSRWLISALDTFADHGTHVQRALAMSVVGPISMIRFYETERQLIEDPGFAPDKYARFQRERPSLWDGMAGFAVWKGDASRKYWARMQDLLELDPTIGAIGRELLTRAAASDTVLGRYLALNPDLLG